MNKTAPAEVGIRTNEKGEFEDIRLRHSALRELIQRGGESWAEPILLYGGDTAAEIELLTNRSESIREWLVIPNFKRLAVEANFRHRFDEIEPRLHKTYYDDMPYEARSRLARMLAGGTPLSDIIGFVLKGPSGEAKFAQPYIGEDFLNEIERLCSSMALVVPWQIRDSILPAFILAVWKRRSRLRPLVLFGSRRFGVPDANGIEIATSEVGFATLAGEIERVYGMTETDVEKAYRVWQLSRSDGIEKASATTPRTVSLQTARSFLSVLVRARTDSDRGKIGSQRPAPLMFDISATTIGLKSGAATLDNSAVVRASAVSLRRRVDRLQYDAQVGNVVPSIKEIGPVALAILDKVVSDDFTDGDIVELGLELNALQWHVDAMKANLSELSLGELTGLFATAALFLARFPTWLEYTGGSAPSGQADDGVAEFRLARELLTGARQPSSFLTEEATKRIAAVLDRTPEGTTAPALREGLVRSGENLAAVTAAGLSHVVTQEARQIGKDVKDKAYAEASKGIVAFAMKNASLLLRLAQMRHWPWLDWLQDHLPH